jgi:hypothetical protein
MRRTNGRTEAGSALPLRESNLLPLINGKPLDLRPPATYQSPFLNGNGGDKITVTVGPVTRLLGISATSD